MGSPCGVSGDRLGQDVEYRLAVKWRGRGIEPVATVRLELTAEGQPGQSGKPATLAVICCLSAAPPPFHIDVCFQQNREEGASSSIDSVASSHVLRFGHQSTSGRSMRTPTQSVGAHQTTATQQYGERHATAHSMPPSRNVQD